MSRKRHVKYKRLAEQMDRDELEHAYARARVLLDNNRRDVASVLSSFTRNVDRTAKKILVVQTRSL